MTFKTKSGSVYEVNHATSSIRCLSRPLNHPRSQGTDGEWRQFHAALIELGQNGWIQWAGTIKGLRTNIITEIQDNALV